MCIAHFGQFLFALHRPRHNRTVFEEPVQRPASKVPVVPNCHNEVQPTRQAFSTFALEQRRGSTGRGFRAKT